MKINVHIDRLVLEGVPLAPGGQQLMQIALETELTRLLAGGGLNDALASGAAMRDVKAADIRVSGDQSPVQLGTTIAGSMYRGIGR